MRLPAWDRAWVHALKHLRPTTDAGWGGGVCLPRCVPLWGRVGSGGAGVEDVVGCVDIYGISNSEDGEAVGGDTCPG